jgi:hypothetical protein
MPTSKARRHAYMLLAVSLVWLALLTVVVHPLSAEMKMLFVFTVALSVNAAVALSILFTCSIVDAKREVDRKETTNHQKGVSGEC